MVRPLLKWAGGKRRIQEKLVSLVPEHFESYYEPFFGGGAIYFALRELGKIKKAVVSDLNEDLYSFYSIVRNDPSGLITSISALEFANTPDHFYAARSLFNGTSALTDPLLKAALLVYLNRHCYNGLFRVNSRGEFNVPFGRYRNPKMPSAEQIDRVSEALKAATLLNCDFEETLIDARSGDLVYLDPPYDPLSATSSFTSYERNGFGFSEQQRLAKLVRTLDQRGVLFILSNSSTVGVQELYSDFNIDRVSVSRAINSKSHGRGPVDEIVVTNF